MRKICAGLLCGLMAVSSYAVNTDFRGNDGDWFNAANWNRGLPGPADVALFSAGRTASVSDGQSARCGSLIAVTGGGAAGYDATANKTTLTVESGAELKLLFLYLIKEWSPHAVYADCEFIQEPDSTVRVMSNLEILPTAQGVEKVGMTQASGAYIFNGGSLTVGNNIVMGRTKAEDLVGRLVIRGTTNDTIAAKNVLLGVREGETDLPKTALIEFYPGAEGVTPLRNTGDWFTLTETAQVTIDLSNYSKEGEKTFLLMEQTHEGRAIDHAGWDPYNEGDVVIRGNDGRYDVSVSFDIGGNVVYGSALFLKITEK